MKNLAYLLLLLSLGANVVLIALLLDAGVSLDGARSQVDLLWNRRKEALEIIRHDWVGRTASEVDELSRELQRKGFIVGLEAADREIGDFVFHVEEGVVVGVDDLDSPGE